MPRTREFDPEQAVEKAVRLFWNRGYSQTSMDDLVKATGVSRYGFYGTFGSKERLFEEVLRRYAQEMASTVQAELRRPDAGMKEIRGYFEKLLSTAETPASKYGCMLCNTAVELAPRDARIAKILRSFYSNVSKTFERALANAARTGEISIPRREIPAKARYMTGALQGLAVLCRAGMPKKDLREYVEVLLASLA